MIVQPNQINEQASIETISSFLRSTPIGYFMKLSIQQIDFLLQVLPSAYLTPINGKERSEAVMKESLHIRRGQLVEYRQKQRKAPTNTKIQQNTIHHDGFSPSSINTKIISSHWWQSSFLNWLRFPRVSNQPAYQSSMIEKSKQTGYKIWVQQSNGQDSQSSRLLPYSDIQNTSCEKEKKNK